MKAKKIRICSTKGIRNEITKHSYPINSSQASAMQARDSHLSSSQTQRCHGRTTLPWAWLATHPCLRGVQTAAWPATPADTNPVKVPYSNNGSERRNYKHAKGTWPTPHGARRALPTAAQWSPTAYWNRSWLFRGFLLTLHCLSCSKKALSLADTVAAQWSAVVLTQTQTSLLAHLKWVLINNTIL